MLARSCSVAKDLALGATCGAHEQRAAFMREWLTQTDPTLAEIHADTLRRSWERLDCEQRATLKAEGLRLAPSPAADEVRALPG
jgi:hypothetical protein